MVLLVEPSPANLLSSATEPNNNNMPNPQSAPRLPDWDDEDNANNEEDEDSDDEEEEEVCCRGITWAA